MSQQSELPLEFDGSEDDEEDQSTYVEWGIKWSHVDYVVPVGLGDERGRYADQLLRSISVATGKTGKVVRRVVTLSAWKDD